MVGQLGGHIIDAPRVSSNQLESVVDGIVIN